MVRLRVSMHDMYVNENVHVVGVRMYMYVSIVLR